MIFKKGNIPLYFQFYLMLKQEIIAGDRPPGSAIATLNELAEQTGISHGMIRKALDLLENEGLIVKNPRRGTFVREGGGKAAWVPTTSLSEIREQLLNSHIMPLSDGPVEPPNRVMAHFEGNDDVLDQGRIHRSHFLLRSGTDERRKDLVDLYIPHWRCRDVAPEELKKNPILTMAADMQIARIRQIARPWFCDHYTSGHLRIPDGTPILHRTIVVCLGSGATLAVLELLTNINALEREIVLESGEGAP